MSRRRSRLPGRWSAVISGEAELTWELWSENIDRSNELTNKGKRAVHSAVDSISEFLGKNWLENFKSRGLPFMSPDWWPANDVPFVHCRLLELGSRFRLLSSASGLAELRKNMRRDRDSFPHGLVQLEVAGFALRAGWEIEFEPPASNTVSNCKQRT